MSNLEAKVACHARAWKRSKVTLSTLGAFNFLSWSCWTSCVADCSSFVHLLCFMKFVPISHYALSVNINPKLQTLKVDFFQKVTIPVTIFKKQLRRNMNAFNKNRKEVYYVPTCNYFICIN